MSIANKVHVPAASMQALCDAVRDHPEYAIWAEDHCYKFGRPRDLDRPVRRRRARARCAGQRARAARVADGVLHRRGALPAPARAVRRRRYLDTARPAPVPRADVRRVANAGGIRAPLKKSHSFLFREKKFGIAGILGLFPRGCTTNRKRPLATTLCAIQDPRGSRGPKELKKKLQPFAVAKTLAPTVP